jgi:hypothetical protein
MYRLGTMEFDHHVATYGPHTRFGYKDFIPQFLAEKYDPRDWAELFRRAGARYVVPVAEHHDGFAMYDCPFSRWTAAKMGPRRDLLRDLAAEVRSRGMVFGVSSHRAEPWFFMNGGRSFDSDVSDPRFADFYGPARPQEEQPDQAHMDDWLCRCCDLVDRFLPQLFWFDWWIEEPAWAPYLQRFAAFYYNRAAEWGKGVVINFKERAFAEGTAVYDVERGQLAVRPADLGPRGVQPRVVPRRDRRPAEIVSDAAFEGAARRDLVVEGARHQRHDDREHEPNPEHHQERGLEHGAPLPSRVKLAAKLRDGQTERASVSSSAAAQGRFA